MDVRYRICQTLSRVTSIHYTGFAFSILITPTRETLPQNNPTCTIASHHINAGRLKYGITPAFRARLIDLATNLWLFLVKPVAPRFLMSPISVTKPPSKVAFLYSWSGLMASAWNGSRRRARAVEGPRPETVERFEVGVTTRRERWKSLGV